NSHWRRIIKGHLVSGQRIGSALGRIARRPRRGPLVLRFRRKRRDSATRSSILRAGQAAPGSTVPIGHAHTAHYPRGIGTSAATSLDALSHIAVKRELLSVVREHSGLGRHR